jgi:hypothetical protein
MNTIHKRPLQSIGYQFIAPEYIPEGLDEYHLRNQQNHSDIRYRQLTAFEIESLVRNNNTSDDWNKILVSDAFNPELVKNCKFFGLIRIGKLEPWYLEFHNLRMPVGLYNSTIISCDFGDNVVVDNVNYMSHYILGNEVMVVNTNELATTSTAKFGNGIVKEGEKESVRIWLEVCNENAGRKILPFNGMLPGDAWMWAKFRDDETLMNRFMEFTAKEFDYKRGYYGKVGDRTVIKNCKIIKDVWIGSDAYLKGANKIKNVTINSHAGAGSQVGEGCELVNGIVGPGCRIFYGVKAVRFVMASHSQLKYGARLINAYLGNNSTISCCEVLNSLIYPFHEQHHNNSFLCASVVMGQSNMAAGATIGSNHNSRGADGELLAGRGFWPGLCVSLKHNSRFASFTMIAKGDYPAELDIPFPFSLVSQDNAMDAVQVMPAYWFMYNLYALARNEWKYGARDLRKEKTQRIETSALAPDSVEEIFHALELLALYTGKAYLKLEKPEATVSDKQAISAGRALLDAGKPVVDTLDITATGLENSRRKQVLLKVRAAYAAYVEMARYYALDRLFGQAMAAGVRSLRAWKDFLPQIPASLEWVNVGGQLIPAKSFRAFRQDMRKGRVKSWSDVHLFYREQGAVYDVQIRAHAVSALARLGTPAAQLSDPAILDALLKELIGLKTAITKGIRQSRAKDYQNPFRKMLYDTEAEMNAVVGPLEDNSFIRQEEEALKAYTRNMKALAKALKS